MVQNLDNETRKEIISRMSTMSNVFKVLALTSLIGLEESGLILCICIIIIAGIMDIYYFYKERYYRYNIDIQINGRGRLGVLKIKIITIIKCIASFSIVGYYLMIIATIKVILVTT